MINRFALSFLCIELDRNEIFRFFGHYILLPLMAQFNLLLTLSSVAVHEVEMMVPGITHIRIHILTLFVQMYCY